MEDFNNKIVAVTGAASGLGRATAIAFAERGGNIVNVASSGGLKGSAYLIPYTAAKAALVHMTRSMAMEFMKENVRINSVCPGAMVTNIMSEEVFPGDADRAMIDRYSGMRPPVEPAAVADLIVYVASDRARNIHGTNLSSDGGVTAD
jgi:meso-butanediol dehydrogenase/(S,S)-butanediol dehydrogenase/diacetyl reductase